MRLFKTSFICTASLFSMMVFCTPLFSQTAYFIDGYHGGVYGHYPSWFTGFIVKQLKENPAWKINLEIEPETWDSVLVHEPAALKELQQLFKNQPDNSRIEYVNPAYGQSYFYNIYGESIIRHLSYGMQKVAQYFPAAKFTTYSSEEPCFTSALPQVLRSFGFKYAALKNPNTCWGGYVKAYGKETVEWKGPDGTALTTVPRYKMESLQPGSTWQTIAWTNSNDYIQAAFKDCIVHPVAMTLQDAGWKTGPWMGNGSNGYQPTAYKTWTDYISNIATKNKNESWRLSQEDIQVSLVWGSQVLQKIAREVRASENKLLMAEKMAAVNYLFNHDAWPADSIKEAWRTLMLSQHHDCWIVPYNKQGNATWAENVTTWTNASSHIAETIIDGNAITQPSTKAASYISVYNTTGALREDYATFNIPVAFAGIRLTDMNNAEVPCQVLNETIQGNRQVACLVKVPAFGFNTYRISKGKSSVDSSARITTTKGGDLQLSTDLYELLIDKKTGGTIKGLLLKNAGNKQLVDTSAMWRFNELRGNFYNDGGVHSGSEQEAELTVLENGPLVIKAAIKGYLLQHPFVQTITMRKGDPKIAFDLVINWTSNVGIGNPYHQDKAVDLKDYQKPFYNDSDKLLALFPVKFKAAKIYKDAPFDVTESRLENTFFNRWDSIKNNIFLSWVDAYDSSADVGLCLLTDHTTTYTHGKDFPLGLNIQYSGQGLWGRNHSITGPTHIKYALIPHRGNWKKAGIALKVNDWNEPLVARLTDSKPSKNNASLVDVSGTGYQLTAAMMDGEDLLLRLYNAEGNTQEKTVKIGGVSSAAMLVELNGAITKKLSVKKSNGTSLITIVMPQFGLRTIRLRNFKVK